MSNSADKMAKQIEALTIGGHTGAGDELSQPSQPAQPVAVAGNDVGIASAGNDLGNSANVGLAYGDDDDDDASDGAAQFDNLDPSRYVLPSLSHLSANKRTDAAGNIQMQSILGGSDERGQITDAEVLKYPCRTVCALLITKGNQQQMGTAWFAGADVLLTAGHNLFDNDHLGPGWVDSIEVFPARIGNRIWKQERVTRGGMAVSTEWRQRTQRKAALDYGLIKLSQRLGDETGWLTIAPWEAGRLQNTDFNVVGYPSSMSSEGKSIPPWTMWGMVGRVTGVTSLVIRYDIDTTGGQSGSPVIAWDSSRAANNSMIVVGIHNQGFRSQGYNQATRITPSVINDIKGF